MGQKGKISRILERASSDFALSFSRLRRKPLDKNPPADLQSPAVAEFSCPELSGHLVVAGNRDFLLKTFPAKISGPQNSDDLLDWERELANRYLGAFKNATAMYGYRIDATIPKTSPGFELKANKGCEVFRHAFSLPSGRGHLEILIYATATTELKSKTPIATIGEAGEAFFFV